ncbi:MAG: oligogalacturonate-specific porin KdgM family protein [Endozoicomonas sp.]
MKTKALAFALAAGAVLPAFSDVTRVADFNIKNSDIALEAGAAFNGFTVLGEYVVDKAAQESKEFTATVKYRYDINENFYLEPGASYTKYLKGKTYGELPDGGHAFRNVDTTKVELKGGWNSDFGLYAAARYRYEVGGEESMRQTSKKDEEYRKVHRTDLTVGYHFESITAQYNWVHKKAKQDQFLLAGGKKSSDTHEIKLSYTDFDKFTPYAEFSVEDKGQRDAIKTGKYKSKDAVKVGVAFTF